MIDDKDIEQLVQDYIGDEAIGNMEDILNGFGEYLRDKGLLKDTEPTSEDVFDAWEKRYNEEYSTGEYCHETSFKWGFEEGAQWQKDQDRDKFIVAHLNGAKQMKDRMMKDYRWMTPHKTKIIQKSWYLEGWNDHKYGQKPQFEPGPDLEQKYRPCHMTGDEVQELCDRNYENGKKDKEEEIMKDAIHCKVFWHDGPLLDYTQEQQDDALEKIGAEVGDKVKLIIVKDNE